MSDIYSDLFRAINASEEDFVKHLASERFIPLNGKITKETADGVCKNLLAMDQLKNSPITLLIASGGGDVSAAQYIIDMIDMLRSEVHGLVISRAASMAVDVLLACKKRMGVPNSRYFLHFTRSGFEVVHDSETIEDTDMVFFKKRLVSDEKRRKEFYSNRMEKSPEEIHKIFRMGEKFDMHYRAEEAKELGIIDEIKKDFKFFPEQSAKA